jgi:hypothetical protein
MSMGTGRELSIDDPIAGPAVDEYQTRGDRHGRLRDIPLEHIQPNPGQLRNEWTRTHSAHWRIPQRAWSAATGDRPTT